MKLEDLRYENLGEIFAWFPEIGDQEEQMVLISYPKYSIRAFYYSCKSLEQLEKSKNYINQGNNNLDAIGFWFMAIESYINSILKVSCIIQGDGFSNYVKQDVAGRMSAFCEMLSLNKVEFYKSGNFQRFQEFKRFRNEIFHDRFDNKSLTFKKTKFSSVPYLCNQVDLMQSSLIALEFFSAFRYSFPGLDLMPSIFIQKDDSFGFVKYDVLYSQLMKPLFEESLKKHELQTDLNTEPSRFTLHDSPLLKCGQVRFLTRAYPKKEGQRANDTTTSFSENLMQQIRNIIQIDTEKKFQIPDYTRKANQPFMRTQ